MIVLGLIALAGTAVYTAYLLVVSGHPVFGFIDGCFAVFSLGCITDIKVTAK